MTYTDALETISLYIIGDSLKKRQPVVDAIAAIEEHVATIERQYASRELDRLGHIVRHALTPAQYYAAEQAARAEHPEAWAGRLEVVQA